MLPETYILSTALQPIRSMQSDDTFGYEALLRLTHRYSGHPLSPDHAFTNLAMTQVPSFDLQCLATHFSISDHPLLAPDKKLFVNVEPVTFIEHYEKILPQDLFSKRMARPEQIVLEITERIKDPCWSDEDWVCAANFIHARGFQLALDDFDLSWDSLHIATLIHPDYIKLDRPFLRSTAPLWNENPPSTQQMTLLLTALFELGQAIGAKCIVEGVETDLQRQIINYSGIEWGQGYLIGRPELVLHIGGLQHGIC